MNFVGNTVVIVFVVQEKTYAAFLKICVVMAFLCNGFNKFMWICFTINAIFYGEKPVCFVTVKKVSVTFSYSVRPKVLICFIVTYFND